MYNEKVMPGSVEAVKKYVLVEIEVPKESKTKSGIILRDSDPTTFKSNQNYRAVIDNCGGDVTNFSGGEAVLLDKLAGTVIPSKGEKIFKICDESLILCTIKNKKMHPDNITPQSDRLLVKVTSLKEKTDSGIIVEGMKGDLYSLDTLGGEVIATSKETKKEFPKGTKIVWEAHAGLDIDFDSVEGVEGKYLLLPVFSVLAKIKK
jgi:co-chaperonin GroES (HSP10)